MELKSLIEAILFAAQRPLSIKEIKVLLVNPAETEESEPTRAFKKTREAEISAAIQELKVDYTQQGRGFQVQEVAGAFQLVSHPQFAPWLKPLFDEHRFHRLSQPALETLAIIAYRQPITRTDIESVRGVMVDGVIQTLLERGLITLTGRAEAPGRPMLYGTTRAFLEHFGLNDLNELPAIEELRRRNLQWTAPTGQPDVNPSAEQTGEPADVEPAPASPTN